MVDNEFFAVNVHTFHIFIILPFPTPDQGEICGDCIRDEIQILVKYNKRIVSVNFLYQVLMT